MGQTDTADGVKPVGHLIMHIGRAKTGTSSLQYAFSDARDDLAALGILYPAPDKSKQHALYMAHLLGPEYATPDLKAALSFNDDAIAAKAKDGWDRLQAEIAQTRPHTLVLSSENYYDVSRFDCFAQFITPMRALADKMTVVVYLRAPDSWYLSARQENLKFIGIDGAPQPGQAFRTVLEPYQGRTDLTIHAHKFDRDSLISNDIVTDFATRYLPDDAARLLAKTQRDTNSAMSPEAMVLLENLHLGALGKPFDKFGPITRRSSAQILKIDNRIAGKTSPQYKPGIAALVHDTALDLDWLRENFNIDFAAPQRAAVAQKTATEITHVKDLIMFDAQRYDKLLQAVTAREKSKWRAVPPIVTNNRLIRGSRRISRWVIRQFR